MKRAAQSGELSHERPSARTPTRSPVPKGAALRVTRLPAGVAQGRRSSWTWHRGVQATWPGLASRGLASQFVTQRSLCPAPTCDAHFPIGQIVGAGGRGLGVAVERVRSVRDALRVREGEMHSSVSRLHQPMPAASPTLRTPALAPPSPPQATQNALAVPARPATHDEGVRVRHVRHQHAPRVAPAADFDGAQHRAVVASCVGALANTHAVDHAQVGAGGALVPPQVTWRTWVSR